MRVTKSSRTFAIGQHDKILHSRRKPGMRLFLVGAGVHSRASTERPDERKARFHSVQPGVDGGAPAAVLGSIARRQHTSAPGTDSMIRVPLSGSTKSLPVVPSRTVQSGAAVTTASTCAVSKLKLLNVRRPGGGPKSP